MKKILLVNKYYHPDIGGVETVVQQHAQLLKYQYSVTVLCISKEFSWYTKNEFINGVKVIRCSSLGTYFSMPLSITFFLHYFINYLKSDVIINHVPFPLMDLAFFIIDRLVKRKNILFWHSDIVKQKALKKILRPFIINTINRSTQILTTSPNLKANSEDIGEYQKKTDVLPLYINSDVINGYIKDLNAEKKYDFIFFGRLCYYKGVDILLDAVKILKNKGVEPEIFMAGDGDLVNYIENEIIENKIK
ncbi:glycosyltransferase, partial [Escherichia coli]|nr:glycosyltransferase [Escherichia coli]